MAGQAIRIGLPDGASATMSTLRRFKKYNEWLKAEERPQVPKEIAARIYRFHARFKVAKTYGGLRIKGCSDELLRGYTEGLRLFLTYTAAERLGDAIKKPCAHWTIFDPALAKRLRRVATAVLANPEGLSAKVQEQVNRLAVGEHDNVVSLATALRHLFAHGHFTPTGQDSTTLATAAALRDLSELIQAETERRFVAWFDEVSNAASQGKP